MGVESLQGFVEGSVVKVQYVWYIDCYGSVAKKL